MKLSKLSFLIMISISISMGCNRAGKESYSIPSEFEEQEYIWLSWVESGFLGGEPFYVTAINAMKEITPYSKVKLFYGPQLKFDKDQIEQRIYAKLIENNIDTSRVTLFYNDRSYGAIQDPGPIFLRSATGKMAIADFQFSHPDTSTASIDRNVATK